MPCSVCKRFGHNKKTCPIEKTKEIEQRKPFCLAKIIQRRNQVFLKEFPLYASAIGLSAFVSICGKCRFV